LGHLSVSQEGEVKTKKVKYRKIFSLNERIKRMKTYGSTSGLEESKEEIDSKDEEVAELFGKSFKVEPKSNIHEKEASSRTKKSNGKNSSGGESITKFSTDNVADSVSRHKRGVHG
jgi:hypothetical protein